MCSHLILETQTSNLKEYNIFKFNAVKSCIGIAINKSNRSPRPFTCESIFYVSFKQKAS